MVRPCEPCSTRSITMAHSTMAMPASMPWPFCRICKSAYDVLAQAAGADQGGDDTIDKDIMIVWLRPVMIDGLANGNSTLNRICDGLPP